MEYNSAIIVESLSDGDVGYSGVIKNKEVLAPLKSEYEIPTRYFVDNLTMLPINPQNSFLYWEITNETLEKFGISPNDVHLVISILDENKNEISSFTTNFSVGDYYFKHTLNHKSMVALLYARLKDDTNVILLSSNKLKLFDPTLKNQYSSPLFDEYIVETEKLENSEAEIVHLNSMSLLKNKSLSSLTVLNKGN